MINNILKFFYLFFHFNKLRNEINNLEMSQWFGVCWRLIGVLNWKRLSGPSRSIDAIICLQIHERDTKEVAKKLAHKLSKIRLWEKENKAWNGSCVDFNYEILIVS